MTNLFKLLFDLLIVTPICIFLFSLLLIASIPMLLLYGRFASFGTVLIWADKLFIPFWNTKNQERKKKKSND